jgi:hypothetical protein
MNVEIEHIVSQIYVFPFVKITHDKWLNGNYEISIGWLNKCITIAWK